MDVIDGLDDSFISIGSYVTVGDIEDTDVHTRVNSGIPEQRRPSREVRHSCSECRYSTTKKYNLMRHMRTHNKTSKPKCTICATTFQDEYKLNLHVEAVHRGKRMICEKCGALYQTREGLHRHLTVKHSENSKLRCKRCNKNFYSRDQYYGHINMHKGVKSEKCATCGRMFRYKTSLRSHIKVCRGKAQPHTCGTCGQTFVLKETLKTHCLGKHSDEAKYRCECGQAYRWRSSLAYHRCTCRERPRKT